MHQSWLLVENGKKIQIRSFMNMCYEEILDAIDDSDIEGEYGWKAFFRDGVYIVHKGGDVRL